MDKEKWSSLNPNLIKPLSLIFGLDEATLSLCYNFMQLKEISHNIVTYFSLVIIRSGYSTISSGKAEESV
jgi:hypothetical protein